MASGVTVPSWDANSRWRARGGVAAAELDGEVAVYDPETELLHLLDAPAAAVWQRLDGQATLAEVAAELAVRAAARADVVEHDVADLLHRLHDLGLVEQTGVEGLRAMR